LKRYLEIAPNGAHAESVALRLANLEKRIAETPVTDAGTPAEQPDAGTPPDTTGSAAPITTLPPPPGGDTPEQEPNRLPAYIAFGVGGLAAAGAVLTGVLAQTEYDDAKAGCAPNCTDDDVASGKSLAVTSTILTGVAVVGVSIGAVLWFTGEPRRTGRAGWDVRVGGAPHGARAEALWRF
jgi:hypothetical protein